MKCAHLSAGASLTKRENLLQNDIQHVVFRLGQQYTSSIYVMFLWKSNDVI